MNIRGYAIISYLKFIKKLLAHVPVLVEFFEQPSTLRDVQVSSSLQNQRERERERACGQV
jgi:hypothetical protein